jgi:hypothetical protein
VSLILPSDSVIQKKNIHHILISAILGVTGLFIFSLYHRRIYVDDPWFADQAYQLIHDGYIRSEMLQGLLKYDIRVLDAHKLHLLHGAVFIKLFGFSPYVVKAIPIPYVFLLIYLFYRYTTENQLFNQSYGFLLLVLVFITHAHVFDYAYIYRPEIMQACLGFASFYFLQKSIHTQQLKLVVFAALLAGVCALFHLNGLVFITSGCLLLLVNRRIGALFLFGSVAGFTSLLYFYDICCMQENISLFIYQITNNPSLEKSNFSAWAYFGKLLDEHMRLFRTVREGALSVCFFLAVLVCFKFLKQHYSMLLSYTFFLIASVALITRDASGRYYILYLPFLLLIVVITADHIFSSRQVIPIRIACVLLLSYLLLNLYLISGIIAKRTDVLSINRQLTRHIPEGAKVMASMNMVFNGLEQYDLQALEAYSLNRKKDLISPSINFLEFCRLHKREYLLVDERDLEKIGMSAKELKRGNKFYTYLESIHGYITLRLREGVNG